MVAAIDIQDLVVRYRTRRGVHEAVRGLSLRVEPGEVVGFLGPNGAGKSSTLKAIMGFVEPTAGECRVFGAPAGSLEAKGTIGYLPEVAMYYPFLTPLETLRLYGELQGMGGRALRAESERLLEAVGVAGAMRKQNRTLSKGMLQRVGIAQALLGSPRLLVLDEVTSGLDPVGRRELRAILRDRQREGCTLFFSSHELSEVEMLCDRILLLNRGRLIEERRMEDLHEELMQFEATFRPPAPIAGLASCTEETPEGVRARFASKRELLEAVERTLRADGAVVDLIAREGSLEDYFVERIARAA